MQASKHLNRVYLKQRTPLNFCIRCTWVSIFVTGLDAIFIVRSKFVSYLEVWLMMHANLLSGEQMGVMNYEYMTTLGINLWENNISVIASETTFLKHICVQILMSECYYNFVSTKIKKKLLINTLKTKFHKGIAHDHLLWYNLKLSHLT